MKLFGVYYWYVKKPLCGYVEYGLEYFSFYVQKHIAHLTACLGPPLVHDALLRELAFLKLPYCFSRLSIKFQGYRGQKVISFIWVFPVVL